MVQKPGELLNLYIIISRYEKPSLSFCRNYNRYLWRWFELFVDFCVSINSCIIRTSQWFPVWRHRTPSSQMCLPFASCLTVEGYPPEASFLERIIHTGFILTYLYMVRINSTKRSSVRLPILRPCEMREAWSGRGFSGASAIELYIKGSRVAYGTWLSRWETFVSCPRVNSPPCLVKTIRGAREEGRVGTGAGAVREEFRLANEDYTSKLCSKCHEVPEPMLDHNRRPIHATRRCRTRSCSILCTWCACGIGT